MKLEKKIQTNAEGHILKAIRHNDKLEEGE